MAPYIAYLISHYECNRMASIQTYSDGFENFFALSIYARKYNEPLYAYLFHREVT